MSSAGTNEPPPVPNDRPAIQDLVIADLLQDTTDDLNLTGLIVADIEERKRLGLRKYGTLLQAHNGRFALMDAYQEGLDLVMYLKQALEEGARVHSEYLYAMSIVRSLRRLLPV